MIKALVLEGPPVAEIKRPGWRHFQIIFRTSTGQQVRSCIGGFGSGERFARDLRGKFFAAGTWENGEAVPGRCFPAPRPEILDLLVSENQRELAV